MICAPSAAALRVQSSCSWIIDSLSPVQVAWVKATRTTDMGDLRCWVGAAGRARAAGPDGNVTVVVEHFCGVSARNGPENVDVGPVNTAATGLRTGRRGCRAGAR